MPVIIGTKLINTKKVTGIQERGRCSNCNRETILVEYIFREWITLFFIPIIPLGKRTLFVCPKCNCIFEKQN